MRTASWATFVGMDSELVNVIFWFYVQVLRNLEKRGKVIAGPSRLEYGYACNVWVSDPLYFVFLGVLAGSIGVGYCLWSV